MAVYKPSRIADTGEADAVPANPTAQNAATAALKPKPVAMGATPDDPNAPALPGVQASSAAPAVNMDPNAYSTPPQAIPQFGGTPDEFQAKIASGMTGTAPPPQAQTALPDLQVADPVTATPPPSGGVPAFNDPRFPTQFDPTKPTTTNPGFGGYDTPNASGVSQQSFDQSIGDKLNAMNLDFSQVNAADLMALSRGAPKGQVADTDALRQKLYNGGTLTPAEQYALRFEGSSTPQIFRPEWNPDGSLKSWGQSQNDMNALGGTKDLASYRTYYSGLEAKNAASAALEKSKNDKALADYQAAKKAGGDTTEYAFDATGRAVPASSLPPIAPAGVPNLPPVPTGPATGMPTPPGEQAVPVTGTPPVNIDPGTTATPGANPALPIPAPSGQPATASGMGNVAQTGTTAENALTNATLSRAPGADRFKIAGDQWDAFTKSTAPQYEADQRSAMRKAAAGGALGSGMLQTSLGDLASNRALAMDTQKQNLLSEALKGTIGDQFGDVGIAQQQQGFQQGQQQQAFGNAVTQEGLQEALTNGGFQRALQSLTAGSSGNPADTALLLSQIFGGQASEAGSSLAQLLSGMGQKSTAGGTSSGGGDNQLLSTIMDYIKKMGGGTTTATPDDHMTP